jgi:hypothetical protein
MKDVISGPIFITTLIAVTGVELMRHHWHIDERMGESSSFSLTNDICRRLGRWNPGNRRSRSSSEDVPEGLEESDICGLMP